MFNVNFNEFIRILQILITYSELYSIYYLQFKIGRFSPLSPSEALPMNTPLYIGAGSVPGPLRNGEGRDHGRG